MSYQFQNITMLIIEDNLPMQNLLKSLLLALGVGKVYVAEDGLEGYKEFCRHNPDIIVADWLMVPMDGIKFTEKVRTDSESVNPFVPIILMTGFSEKQRVMRARDAGVTEFLVKPFKVQDLYKRIAQIIERPRQFVKSEDFFGPDRRRHEEPRKKKGYAGPLRREEDQEKLESKKKSAYEVMKAIREKNKGEAS